MKQFYLDRKSNIVFILFICCNIILCVLSNYVELNFVSAMLANLITIIGPVVTSLVHLDQGKNEIDLQEKKLEEVQVNRNAWFQELISCEGITLLTGVSGIGKSYLLKQLREYLTENGAQIYFKENNYFFSLNEDEGKEKIEEAEFIILDQFERALPLDNIVEIIGEIKQIEGKKIIISVRSEYYGDTYKLLYKDRVVNMVWLDYRADDLKDINRYLSKIAFKTLGELEKNALYSRILFDVEKNQISLIQLSNLGIIIQEKNEDYLLEKLEDKKFNYDDVVIGYLEERINNYEYSDIAYIILYLLSLDQRGRYVNEMKDFQNVAIESEAVICKTVTYLEANKWIKKVKDTGNIRSNWNEYYEISHDYFLMLFAKLCREKIDQSIRDNIGFYNINCQQIRGVEENEDSWKNYTNKVCKRFLCKKNHRYINIGLGVMMVLIGIFNLYLVILNPSKQEFWMVAFINLVVGESIYYVYNYYYNFLSIFRYRYLLGVVIGSVSCIIPFIFREYWALPLGIEICVVGIIMHDISCRVKESERIFFTTRRTVFIGIGIIVAVLGGFFSAYANNKLLFAAPLFGLYGGYMFMGIVGHINKKYLLAIVGRTLYGGRRMKIK